MQAFEYMFVFSKPTMLGHSHAKRSARTDMQAGKIMYARWVTKTAKHLRKVSKQGITAAEYLEVCKRGQPGRLNRHPATFPEALARDHILSWSNPGDTVLDPFLGSGTTGKMAVLNGREFIGIDISPEYVDLATGRINAASLGASIYEEPQ